MMKKSKGADQEVKAQPMERKLKEDGQGSGRQSGAPKADDEGWQTVTKKTKIDKDTERSGDQKHSLGSPQHKTGGRSSSPIRRQEKDSTRTGGQRFSGRKAGEADQGDGSRVYAQLIMYLLNKAPSIYVLHTVLRLRELTAERRFRAHLKKIQKQHADTKETVCIRREWDDAPSHEEQDRYRGVVSQWNCDNEEHLQRLSMLLGTWVLKERIPQVELEKRLRHFHMRNIAIEPVGIVEQDETLRSYKEAVAGYGEADPTSDVPQDECQRLYQLCMQPAEKVNRLRTRTADEDKALDMITKGQLEVPVPPRFLIQSMDARELAAFTDNFMAIEYPLYAHLLPGHRFGKKK
ncbi:hypothetical protein DVH05_012336 [Phytophthora capsici]|nr:hypothetical protein DVH05_012336 [Phytophthora capsici]